MRLRLSELQESDEEAKLLRGSADLPEGWKDVERVLQYQRLTYVPEIIRSEVISRHHNNLLAGHFGINKTRELIGRKYYWSSLRRDVKSYIQGCDVCLTSKRSATSHMETCSPCLYRLIDGKTSPWTL